MPEINNALFYSGLPVNDIPLAELLAEEHLFHKIPGNWYVVITDVKNSTRAILEGMHETVNLLATASIVAVLNIAYKANIAIPYFFGGDGATFIVPPSIFEEVMKALSIHKENTIENHGMELRVGSVPVGMIDESGEELKISKFKTSALFSIPVLIGSGLALAEKIVKGEGYLLEHLSAKNIELDLTGMECRWDRIKPPENNYEVVSLLVTALRSAEQCVVFKKVIDRLDEIYGAPHNRRPISVSKLKLKTTLSKIRMEMRTKLGGFNTYYFFKTCLQGMLGIFYFRTKQGKSYLDQLVQMSDTLVIDGRINTVIAGTPQQRELLESSLNEIEQAGEIVYGLYVSKESVMSCYVRNMNEGHIHFVDGADGGYTKAAGMLKKKISSC